MITYHYSKSQLFAPTHTVSSIAMNPGLYNYGKNTFNHKVR
jgi:hypothetical protein